jgi:S-adenosylmethionine synthetase
MADDPYEKSRLEIVQVSKKKHVYFCGFCGVPDTQADKMLDGINSSICDKCIDRCYEIIHDGR